MSADREALLAFAGAMDRAESPADLRADLAALRAVHPDAQAELTVDVEPYDRRTSYHVAFLDSAGTRWALAKDAPGGLPWPLRGVMRSSERDLLRVGGRTLEVDEAVATLDHIWSEAGTTDLLVNATLAEQEIEDRALDLDDDELQRAVDAFRRGKGLHTATATQAWLDDQGLAFAGLVDAARGSALVARLRRQIALEASAEDQAAARERVFDLYLAWTEPGESVTDELASDPRVIIDHARAGRHAGMARWRAEDLPDGFKSLLDAPVGTAVEVADGRLVATVLARHRPAPEHPDTRRRWEQLLFDAWLVARRASVDVEWLWGVNAVNQTGP